MALLLQFHPLVHHRCVLQQSDHLVLHSGLLLDHLLASLHTQTRHETPGISMAARQEDDPATMGSVKLVHGRVGTAAAALTDQHLH